MTRLNKVAHEFVEFIPEELRDGTIYVSIPYATAVHKCCCGCGQKVVTPITPTDWRLTFDGETISLDPSIGSWNLPCESHYWIIRNKVQWAGRWSKERIDRGRAGDRELKERYYAQGDVDSPESEAAEGLWDKLLGPFSKKRRKR